MNYLDIHPQKNKYSVPGNEGGVYQHLPFSDTILWIIMCQREAVSKVADSPGQDEEIFPFQIDLEMENIKTIRGKCNGIEYYPKRAC